MHARLYAKNDREYINIYIPGEVNEWGKVPSHQFVIIPLSKAFTALEENRLCNVARAAINYLFLSLPAKTEKQGVPIPLVKVEKHVHPLTQRKVKLH